MTACACVPLVPTSSDSPTARAAASEATTSMPLDLPPAGRFLKCLSMVQGPTLAAGVGLFSPACQLDSTAVKFLAFAISPTRSPTLSLRHYLSQTVMAAGLRAILMRSQESGTEKEIE